MIRRNYELANMNSFHSSLRKNRLLANVLRFCFTLDSFFLYKKALHDKYIPLFYFVGPPHEGAGSDGLLV